MPLITIRKIIKLSCLSTSAVVCLVAVYYFLAPTNQVFAQATAGCSDVRLIFARGSSEELDANPARRFFDKVETRIDDPVVVDRYELGEGWPGYDDAGSLYPAVAVNEWGNYLVGLGAKTTGGSGFSYGTSVSFGVNELQTFLALNSIKCPDTKYVLGGYSQGAQVVGQALSGISKKAKDNIVFVALFGDPKLNLPEGRGLLNPPACKGEQFSNWRRDVPDCRTHEGALGARTFYIPSDFRNKVGLWCNDRDWVCGSSLTPAHSSGHSEYASENGAIDKAAHEIARRLKSALPYPKNYYIDDRYLLNSDGEARLNVAYIWSTNASSYDTYEQAKLSILSGADMVWSQGGRVSITPFYEDSWGSTWMNPIVRITKPDSEEFALFTRINQDHIEQSANYFPYSPIVYPHDDVLGAAVVNLDRLPWQAGAEKALIFVAESADFIGAGQYRFLPSAGRLVSIADYVALRALEIDPVNTYFVLGSEEGLSGAQYLADMTGGKVVRYDPANPQTLNSALLEIQQEIIDRPVVVFGRGVYETHDGNPVVFDVSSSYPKSGEIVSYDWDYDGDGTWDHSTTEPHASHLYDDGFDGLIHVKATDSSGRFGTMTAEVESLPMPDVQAVELPLVQGIKYEILETNNGKSTVRLMWNELNSVPYVVLSVDGVPIGHILTDRTTIDITDTLRNKEVSIDLQAMDEDYNIGQRSGVVVPMIVDEPVTLPSLASAGEVADRGSIALGAGFIGQQATTLTQSGDVPEDRDSHILDLDNSIARASDQTDVLGYSRGIFSVVDTILILAGSLVVLLALLYLGRRQAEI